MVATNCLDEAKTGGHCVMKSSSCLDKTCDNLSLTDHDSCYNESKMNNTCTVNATDDGC